MNEQPHQRLSEASLRPTNHARRVQPATHSAPPATSAPAASVATAPAPKRGVLSRLWHAFKDVAVVFSFIVNFVLVLVIVLLVTNANELLTLGDTLLAMKQEIAEPWLLDLDQAFAGLGETTIDSTVHIDDTMPVVFDLPLEQHTDVVLTAPVPLNVPAQFILPGGGGAINGTVSLNLPQGQTLPIALGMSVPVSTTVPVVMQVPVRIQLAECGMAPAIEQLRAVFRPITALVHSLPDSTEELFQRP